MGDDIGVLDLDGSIGGSGSEEGSDDASGLVGTAHVRVADVEEDHRVDPCAHARRRTCALEHRLLATCHRRCRHFRVDILLPVTFSNFSSRLGVVPPPPSRERGVGGFFLGLWILDGSNKEVLLFLFSFGAERSF